MAKAATKASDKEIAVVDNDVSRASTALKITIMPVSAAAAAIRIATATLT